MGRRRGGQGRGKPKSAGKLSQLSHYQGSGVQQDASVNSPSSSSPPKPSSAK